MSHIEVSVDDSGAAFRPGDTIEGAVRWKLEESPRRIDVHLFWRTEGKGSCDVEVVDRTVLDNPGSSGDRQFRFAAPSRPYSFSGRLITLVWAVEAIAEPAGTASRAELSISPTGQAIELATSGGGSEAQ